MMSPGEDISSSRARGILRDIGMEHLDQAHGAAIDTVRWCLLVRGRPTHRRLALLEAESPALLAYLEKLASSGDAAGWRALEQRIRFHAEILRETGMQPCSKPWLAAIWHCLPELAAIGQCILDRYADDAPAPEPAPAATETTGGTGGDGDTGTGGKAGSAGTSNKPRPSRLSLPVVSALPTQAEEKALGLGDDTSDAEAEDDVPLDDPDGTKGPKMPGGPK